MMNFEGQIESNHSLIESLRSDIVAVKEAKLTLSKEFNTQRCRIEEELSHMTNLKDQCELELKKKENEISKMLENYEKQRKTLDNAHTELEESRKAQEKLRMSQHDAYVADAATIQTLTSKKDDLEAEILECRKEINELKCVGSHRKQEILTLQDSIKKFESDSKHAVSKLVQAEEGYKNIEIDTKSIIRAKDAEIGEMKFKLSSLEHDSATLRKEMQTMANSSTQLQEKNSILHDRFTLLQREKNNLEFELNTMERDHNDLSDKVSELQSENERLQKVINDLDNVGDQSHNHSDECVLYSNSRSIQSSDSRLSYDMLTTNMDNMLEKISKKEQDPILEDAKSFNFNEEAKTLDDTFDESLFLPNAEDQLLCQDTPIAPTATNQCAQPDKENQCIKMVVDNHPIGNVDAKVALNCLPCSTASK